MITAAQLRAARGLLDWTRSELAKAANISPETVKNIEHGTFRPQETTADAIVKAFAAHDVEFVENDGVRKASTNISIMQGFEDFKNFMDDIYSHALQPSAINGDKPIYVCNVDNKLFKQHLKEYASVHINRMIDIKNLNIKILAPRKDETHISAATYLKYRFVHASQSALVPFYVYGDKLGIINFDTENAPKIIVIKSSEVASSYRTQFALMWDGASDEPENKD